MATSVDYRIVEAQFRNSQFEKNIATSTNSLERFKKALDLEDSAKGLEKLDAASDVAGLKHLGAQVDKVADKFSAMGVVAFTALQRITNSAIDTGVKLVKSLSVDQITSGWSKYEQKTANVQTLVNATGKSVEDINGYLDKLMQFSDETSYDFSTMASSLGQMVTSGGDIEKLIPMIEGIANATSFAGKGAAEFSRSIYNLNQSYSQGALNLMDWRSVELSGVASQQLKETFIEVGKALGTLDKEGRTAKGTLVDIGNFSTTLADKWATREVMEQAFGRFAMVTEAAYEMVQQGLADTYSEAYAMLEGQFDQVYYRAARAAQEAKTLGEAINATKDAVSSGWMSTFDYIFGGYGKAKEIWTSLANDLWEVFAAPAQARNAMLKVWASDDMGGQAALWEGLTNIFQSLLQVIYAVREGFEEIFPMITAKRLTEITKKFRDFTKSLEVSEETYSRIKAVASGLASLLKVMLIPLKLIVSLIGKLATSAAPLTGYILDAAAYVGQLTTNIVAAIDESQLITAIFENLGNVVKNVAAAFKFVAAVIASGIGAMLNVNLLDFSAVQEALSGIPSIGTKVGSVFGTIGEKAVSATSAISSLTDSMTKWATAAKDKVVSAGEAIGRVFSPVANRIREIFKDVTLSDAIGTTLLVGLYQQIKKLVSATANMKVSFAGVTKALTNVLNVAGDALKTFQNKVNAEVIKTIAISVGILAASLFLISKVDAGSMGASLIAVGMLFGELTFLLAQLGNSKFAVGKAEIITLSGAMIGMSIALAFLAKALTTIASVKNIDAIDSATVAIGVLMATMTTMTGLLSIYAGDKDILRLSVVLLAFGASLRILSDAIVNLSGISWGEVLPGLAALVGGLTAVTLFLAALKVGSVTTKKFAITSDLTNMAGTLVAIGVALMALVVPIKILGSMDLKSLKAGSETLTDVLGALFVFMAVMKVGSIKTEKLGISSDLTKMAGTLIALSVALTALVVPIQILGKIPTDQLSQGFEHTVGLIGALTISLSMLKVTSGNLAGVSVSLLALAAALNLLIIPIGIMGVLPFTTLLKGMAGLVIAVTALCGTVYIIGKFSAAFGKMSASIAGFAVGALVMVGAIAALTAAVATLATLGTAAAAGLAGFLEGIKIMAPVIEEGLVAMIEVIAHSIRDSTPALVEAVLVVIDETLKGLVAYTPSIIENLSIWLIQIMDGLTEYAEPIKQSFIGLFTAIFGEATKESIIFSLTACITALVGSLKILSMAKKYVASGLIGAAGIAGAIVLVGGPLMLLQKIGDISKILETSVALSLIMLAMTAVMKAAGGIGAVGTVALKGLAIVLAGIGIVIAIFGAFGKLASSSIGKKVMEGNVAFMGYLGDAIGAFINGIREATQSTTKDSFLTRLGKELKEFWETAKGFFEGISRIDPSAFANIKSMAVALAAIAGADFIDRWTKLPFTESSFTKVAKELSDMAPYLNTFFEELKDVETSKLDNIGKIFEAIGEIVNVVPKRGGIVGLFEGENWLYTFTAELAYAAPKIKEFTQACIGLNSDSPRYAALCSEVIQAITPCIDSVPKYAGLEGFIFGDNLISIFAAELASAAPNIVEFTNTMADAPADAVGIAKQTSDIIANLAEAVQAVPENAKRKNSDFSSFAKHLTDFGDAIVDYSMSVASANIPAMNAASRALRNLVGSIQNTNILHEVSKKMKNTEWGIYNMATNIANNLVEKFAIRTADFQNIGINYLKGIQKGFMNPVIISDLGKTVTTTGNFIDSTMRQALDIHSPSGKGKLIGELYGMGIRYGLDGSKKEVLLAGRKLANDFLKDGRITMQELNEVYEKFNTDIASAENKRLFILSSNNRVTMEQLVDETGSGMDGIVDEILARYNVTGEAGASLATALDEGLSSGDPKGKGQTAAEKFIEGVQSQLSILSTKLSGRSLEQQVWEKLYGGTATEAQKNQVQLKLLESNLDNYKQTLAKTQEEYDATLAEYGASSEKTVSAYNKLLQAQLNLIEASEAITSYQDTSLETNRNAMREYAKWMADYKDMLLEQGFALEQIERVARKDTGYDPNLMVSDLSNVTKQAQEALEIVKQSYGSNATDFAESLVPYYLKIGTDSAQAISDGIQNGASVVQESVIEVNDASIQAAQLKNGEWVGIGTEVCNSIATGINSNSGIVTSAVSALLSAVSLTGSSGTVYQKNLSSGIQILNRDISSEIDTTPVIRPVIDASAVKKGADTIGSIIGSIVPGSRTLGLVMNIASGVAKQTTDSASRENNVTNTYTFNQTNNSPKALSNATIYRQSRNLMSQLESKTV